jgi:hypothetical protein
MAAVDLTPYDVRSAQIAQQQKLAQLLAQQAQAPIEVGSYKGIQAPISPYSGINKILQNVLAAYDEKKSKSDATSLMQDERDAYLKAVGGDASAPASPPPDFSAGAPSVPDASQFEIAPGQGQKLAAVLQGQAAPQAPPPVAAPIAAPQGPDPTATPDPTQGPPQGNGPAIASALQGPPPQATPPAPAPMPTLPPQGPQIGPAPDVTMGPQATPPPQAPASDATPPDPMQARLAAAQANLQKARATAAQFAGTPYAAPAAAAVTAAQEQVKKIGDLQDAATAKEAERVADVARGHVAVATLAQTGALPPALAPTAQAVVEAGGVKALEPFMTQIAKNALTPGWHWMTPDEHKAGNVPLSVAMKVNDLTGEPKMVFDGLAANQAQQRITLEKQSVGIAAGNLSLRRAEFNRDNLAPPTTVEHIVNGEPVQVTAMFDKRNGRYIDMTGKPVDPTGLRVLPAGSSRATLGLLRVATAAADAATGIDNLSKLPANSNLGWFSQAANTPVGALKRTLTPQEAQDMRATVAGLSRAMGGLATGGLAVDIPTQQSYEALIPQAGQTRLTAIRQMGELRQQAVNGIESALANPYITPAQKANLTSAKTKIESAVPWTPNDVSALETSKNPSATMHGMGVGTLRLPASGSKAPAGVDPKVWSHMTPQEQALWH